MEITELLFTTSAVFLLVLILLIPPGHLLAKRVVPELAPDLQLMVSFAFSVLLYALPVAVLCLSPVPNGVIQGGIALFALTALARWLSSGAYRSVITKEHLSPALVLLFLVNLCLIISAAPNGSIANINPTTTRLAVNLPVDLLIPYNVSRYFVEKIPFTAIEAVPTWRGTDRGPLGGVMYAVFSLLLGLKEYSPWLSPTPKLFHVYQTVLSSLNLLSAVFVWFFAKTFFGRRAGAWSLFFLATNYFYLQNVLFLWPKFFMAYLFLCAVFLFQTARRPILSGVLFGAAQLAHDSAVFGVAAFGAYLCWHTLFAPHNRTNSDTTLKATLSPVFLLVRGYLVTLAPWIAFKRFFAPSSPRGLYLHLFCNTEQRADLLSLSEALESYLSTTTPLGIIKTKAYNLLYPFDPRPLFLTLKELATTPITVTTLREGMHLSFAQLLVSVGVVPFLFVVWGLTRRGGGKELTPYLVAAFGALPIYALLAGCWGSTTNHCWAYQAYLVFAVVLGRVASNAGSAVTTLLGVGIGINLGVSVIGLHYSPQLAPYLRNSPELTASQLCIASLLLLVLLKELWATPNQPHPCRTPK